MSISRKKTIISSFINLSIIQTYLVFCFLIFSASSINAQIKIEAQWLRHSCGYTNGINLLGGNVWGDAVCSDNNGNSYNSGSFAGNWFTMDTVIEMGLGRFYINKYNNSGGRIWTSIIRGTNLNTIITCSKMLCDDEGNIYLCGMIGADSVYMKPNWYSIGSGFIAKYDKNGLNLWCKYISKSGNTAIDFTDMTISGNDIYLCGNMGFGTLTFGSFTLKSNKSQNGVIAKMDKTGNIYDFKPLDTSSVNEIYGIEVSPISKYVYLIGRYLNSDFQFGSKTLTHTDFATNSFVLKIDKSFNAIWAKKCLTYLRLNQTAGNSVNCLRKIELDKFDNIYVTANGNGDSTILGNLKFTHRVLSNSSYAQDIYLAKIDKNGNELWMKHGGSNEMDYVNDLITDKWGNSILSVFSGSQSSSGLIFGTDTIPQWHGGLVKYDPYGKLIYVQKLQEAKSLKSLSLGIDSTFYGTGHGFSTGHPYINLSITNCEDTLNGYNNPPYKMVMVKFYDNKWDKTTSINQIRNNTSFVQISPNPTNNKLLIQFERKSLITKEIFIINQLGKSVVNLNINDDYELDLSNLSTGIYFLKVIENNSINVIKFIKQ